MNLPKRCNKLVNLRDVRGPNYCLTHPYVDGISGSLATYGGLLNELRHGDVGIEEAVNPICWDPSPQQATREAVYMYLGKATELNLGTVIPERLTLSTKLTKWVLL